MRPNAEHLASRGVGLPLGVSLAFMGYCLQRPCLDPQRDEVCTVGSASRLLGHESRRQLGDCAVTLEEDLAEEDQMPLGLAELWDSGND